MLKTHHQPCPYLMKRVGAAIVNLMLQQMYLLSDAFVTMAA